MPKGAGRAAEPLGLLTEFHCRRTPAPMLLRAWRLLLSSRRWLPPLLSASWARLTRPLVGDGQVDELWRAGEYVCHRRLHGFQPFLAARVPLARTRFLLAFEHGQDVGLGRVHLVPHEHLPHQARAGLLGGP